MNIPSSSPILATVSASRRSFMCSSGALSVVAVALLEVHAQGLNAASLKNQAGVLNLPARLELGATNAYLGVIPAFQNSDLAKAAARLAADETLHHTVLTQALGRPLPAGALTFGA